MMRKQYLRILIALVGAAGLAKAAKGQVADQIVVNVPHEFVVAGKTLPAGTYRVNRVPNPVGRMLVFSSVENRVSAIVLATDVETIPADKARISLEQVDGQYFLSKIETADHVFNILVSRSAIMEAAAISRSVSSTSESVDGSN
jgi:hypothetical protein